MREVCSVGVPLRRLEIPGQKTLHPNHKGAWDPRVRSRKQAGRETEGEELLAPVSGLGARPKGIVKKCLCWFIDFRSFWILPVGGLNFLNFTVH